MISIVNATKRFGRATAVDDVSLEIPAGQSVALWGANGAGKTTLIRCVLGLLRFRGRITVGGLDVWRHGKQARLQVGYVPQELGFYDELGVANAISFFARLKGQHDVRSGDALHAVGLSGHGTKRIRELSGGMKQRLALAIALIGDPPVLVLDEVTASLDAVGRDEFVALLRQLSGAGRTMLFASHRIEEVAALADSVAMLRAGRLVATHTCTEFMAHMGHGAVLHLTLAPEHRDRAMRALRGGGFMPSLNGVGVLVPVDPEHKAAPFRVLAEDRIRVDDFELVTASRAAALAAHKQEARS